MKQGNKVNIIFGIIAVIAIIIAIFALNSPRRVNTTYTDYEEHIQILSDTIKELKEDIAKYKREIERIDLERETIRESINQIIKDNEKIDTDLANGSLDDNILFLSEYLSKRSSDRK